MKYEVVIIFLISIRTKTFSVFNQTGSGGRKKSLGIKLVIKCGGDWEKVPFIIILLNKEDPFVL